MLIINADDWGKNKAVTDNALICFKNSRINSSSAMVFMSDSQRAAELAREHGLPTGLHLNFTQTFDGIADSSELKERHRRISSFLKRNKYFSLLYNPFLNKDFEYVYKAQIEEYARLYKEMPDHIDGHNHMHLCTNLLFNKLIPKGYKVRRTFSFSAGDKNFLNRFYRSLVAAILVRRYSCTDFFFSITPPQDIGRLQGIINMAMSRNVELMVHPERKEDFHCLMSDEFFKLISEVKKGGYALL